MTTRAARLIRVQVRRPIAAPPPADHPYRPGKPAPTLSKKVYPLAAPVNATAHGRNLAASVNGKRVPKKNSNSKIATTPTCQINLRKILPKKKRRSFLML